MDRTILNWVDSTGRPIDGSVKRPPKPVRLRELRASEPAETFHVYQVYDNVVRRLLGHLGLPRTRWVTDLPSDSTLPAVTTEWELPVATGARLRAKYVFTAGSRKVISPALFSHRLGHVGVHGVAEVNVGVPIVPVQVGAGGSGGLETDVLLSTDPAIAVHALLPWEEGSYSLRSYVQGLLHELASVGDVDFDALRALFDDVYGDCLPEAANGLEIRVPEVFHADEGDVKRLTLELEATAPCETLFAIGAEAADTEEDWAVSELAILHVTPELDIYLWGDVEGGVVPIADEAGILAPQEELVPAG